MSTTQAGDAGVAGAGPRVGIIMGSSSDLAVMAPAAEILDDLGVPIETTIVSAHRTPRRMAEYAETARKRGLKVIIAGAGGAAHLPGMVAAMTTLPVVGVPVRTSTLSGVDSLLSIVQMPRGVPVATVAINNGKNAGLLAARILSITDRALAAKLADYQAAEETRVLAEAHDLEEQGPKRFLADRQK